MMRRMTRLLAVLLALALIVVPISAYGAENPQNGAVVKQTVTSGDTSVEVFRYTPADFNFLGNNTPILFVLGDQAYTEESANAALQELGLQKIADEAGAHVLFVSPAGETWSEADVAAIQILAGNASDNYFYGTDYSAGVGEDGKFFAGRFRHYYFAEGSGAEFARTYLDKAGVERPIPEWGAKVDVYGAGFVYAEDGFTAELVEKGWEAVKGKSIMYINSGVAFSVPYYDWTENDIALTVKTFQTEYEDLPEIEYYQYVPKTVDLNSKTEKYPLVLLFHGSGMHPDAIAQNTSMPILAKQEGFVVLSVNGMYNTTNNANAMADLIDYMVENYAIDASRVYAVGFSKGARESMEIGGRFARKVAGIGLYEPVLSSMTMPEPEAVLPTYLILGQDEFYTVFPRDTENAVTALNTLGKANGFSYAYDKEIGGFWGYTFDLNASHRFAESRAVMNEHSIASEKDGVVYTKLVDVQNMSHNVLPAAAERVWGFLKQFRRNSDGTLSVQETNKYTDLPRTEWYYYPVKEATESGLFNGMTADTFEPETEMTRAMLVMTLYRLAGQPTVSAANPFTDVKAGEWYETAVRWAAENGVVNGVTPTTFDPEATVTREQFVTMLFRYAEACGAEVSKTAELTAYADQNLVSDYARDAMGWAVEAGLVNGIVENGKPCLNPLGGATRAETATLLVRFQTVLAPLNIQ